MAGLTIICAISWGETVRIPNLKSLQGQLDADLIKATTPVLSQLLAEMQTLEKKAVTARDYDTAIAVRNERRKIESQLARQQKAALLISARQQPANDDQQDHIILKAADARLDRVRLDSGSGLLVDWGSVGASATWQLPNLAPGGYEVVLHYSAGALEGGSVMVQEAFYSLNADLGTTLNGLGEQNLGTLRIREGSGSLKIAAKAVVKSNLMQLQSVELIPANR